MAINFNKDSVINLRPISEKDINNMVPKLMIHDESIVTAFKTIRDQLIFTTKRIISIDSQGITGKRTSYASLPYKSIQYYSIQTPGFLELVPDAELEISFANGVNTKFEFKGNTNIADIDKAISNYVLKWKILFIL